MGKKKVPNRVRELRTSLNLSAERLAQRAGLTRQTIERLEAAEREDMDTVRVGTVRALATALGVSPRTLFPSLW